MTSIDVFPLSSVILESRMVLGIEILLTCICAANLSINVFVLKRTLQSRRIILDSGIDGGAIEWMNLCVQFKWGMVIVQCLFICWGLDRTYVTLGMITHVELWTFVRYGLYRITASILVAFFTLRFYLAHRELVDNP